MMARLNMSKASGIAVLFAACLSAAGGPVSAQAGARPTAIRPLLDCRKVAVPEDRLACFDRESASLEAADAANEIAVLDKEDVRKTRRSLFGLALPPLPFLGGGKSDEGEPDGEGEAQLTATITSTKSLGYGKWAFALEDGAQWVTTEAVVYGQPTKGKSVVLKRAALGGYFAVFEGSGRTVRAKRVN